MDRSRFFSIAFLPDGGIYDSKNWLIDELVDRCPYELSRFMALDSVRHDVLIDSPIGQIEFIWLASSTFASSTLLRNGMTFNTAIFLPGRDAEDEQEQLKFYLDSWRSFKVVRELCGDDTPFMEAERIKDRPLALSINWATINKAEYDHVAYYDLFIASKYFQDISEEGNG